MLENGAVATRLPAQDLARARAFYAEKLGLEPAEERPGGLLYRCARGEFALFQTDGAPSGSHTQMAWQVDDIGAVVTQLRARGVVFEDYDTPELATVGGIAEIAGNYPSKGGAGERAAWFKDSEGNLLAIGQPRRDAMKRPADRPEPRRLVELSHQIHHGMLTYPGLPGPKLGDYLPREASPARYGPGTEFHIGRISMVANTGTYVDSPFHRFAGATDVARLPLHRVADLDGMVGADPRWAARDRP